MAKTGERYVAARRALIAQTDQPRKRVWMAEPEVSDSGVTAATGKGWEQWCDISDQWAGVNPKAETAEPITDHTAIATYLRDELGVDAWWSQGVTVGYERITGLRLPYQRPDGTFTAGKSATLNVDGVQLRNMLLSDQDRQDLFPGHQTELLSRPDAKRMRVAIGTGVVEITIDPATTSSDDSDAKNETPRNKVGNKARNKVRYKVSVSHRKLSTFDEVETWKHYWGEWLAAVGDLPAT